MLIYVIPFILLLVIAIVLKKREASKQAEQTSTAKAKTKGKKVSSTKKTPQKTQIVADPIIEKKKTTPLSQDQRNKIESLIAERNFFSAEAQINQALNKDNSQHELYLLLLDLHISQKDEFAINQLINHLRSLELDDFLTQAQAKKTAYDQETKGSRDSINFEPQFKTVTPAEPKRTDDFDALMSSSIPSVAENTPSFEQFQQDVQSTQTESVKNIEPLDFNDFSFNPTFDSVKAEMPETVEEIKPVDFSNLSLEPQPAVPPQPEIAPVEDIQPLDFSFSVENSLEQSSTAVIAKLTPESEQNETPEFNFNFSTTDTLATTEVPEIIHHHQPNLEFNLNTLPTEATQLDIASEQNLDEHFDLPTANLVQINPNDPLAQSFPELVTSNELSVNLELAEQYILLGAAESARELLTENEPEYTATQRLQADELLKQIAS